MTRKTHLTHLAAALALALGTLATATSHAEGLYLGGNIASPNWRNSSSGVGGDDSGVGVNVYGGYAINPNFSLEAGVMTLGKTQGLLGDAKATGGYLDAVGTFPIAPQWSLLGRVGYANAKIKTDLGDDSGGGVKFGAGVQYDLTPTTALRGEWARYRIDAFNANTNIDQYSVGVKLGF
ncbi:MAG TPA: porin family protein [Ideonella sp.]|nr:porin family protein [Ideonella sp.]